jgi:branched-chain amino acid transport system substrate-binding protein
MRADRAAALALAVTALVVVGCGADERPLRIGVVVDCVGVNRPFERAELAGAELPLVHRGARLHGGDPRAGIGPATIAGRPVELVTGCTELWEFSTLALAVRRLVEREHVDVVVAGASGPDGLTVRDVAALYPRVSFLLAVHAPREVTLRHRSANLYRVTGDQAQGVAGLGTYAYRALGWRRAAVAASTWDTGWTERDAFVAEFCALGGEVVAQMSRIGFDPDGRDVADVPRDVDGVAVFSPAAFGPEGFVARLARRLHDPRRIVVGPSIADDPDLLRSMAGSLAGATAGSFLPAVESSTALRSYLSAMRRTFPTIPSSTARNDLVLGYRTAVETVARAIEHADSRTSRLAPELRRFTGDLPGGARRLDANGSAVIASSIVRIGRPPRDGADPRLTQVGGVPAVDQSIGGLLAPALSPSSAGASCRSAAPPPWAR